MISTRQNKIARLLQKELSNVLHKQEIISFSGKMITVTNVRVTADLSIAKAYLSVFPSEYADEILHIINAHASTLKYSLGKNIRNQLKKIPDIQYYIDDSLDYIENIENLLKK